jgi:hypothetical protein
VLRIVGRFSTADLRRRGGPLFQHHPQRMDDAGNPEEKAQDNAQDCGLGGIGFKVNRQRRRQEGENGEE